MAPSRRKSASKKAAAEAARRQWNVGDLVLAKVKGFPAWPATILERAKNEAASMELSLDGAQLTGMEAAKGSDHGMGAAIVGLQVFGSSDDEAVARCEVLSRVNERLSRHNKSDQENVAWLMSLLDGLSIPKSSAGTSLEVKITSELSKVKFCECEVDEVNCS